MSQTARTRPIHHQAARFAALSAFSFLGSLCLAAMLHEAVGISSYFAVPLAMGVITLTNFITLRLVIFQQTDRGWLNELVGFLGSIAGFRIAEYGAFILLYGIFNLPYLPSYAAILGASAIGKFLFLRHVLFRVSPCAEPSM